MANSPKYINNNIKIRMNNHQLYGLIHDNPLVESSYSRIYHEFKDIFDNICVSSPYSLNPLLTVRINLLYTLNLQYLQYTLRK